MSVLHCLLDTSALVKKYNQREAGADIVTFLFCHPRLVTIHFADICIPEVRNTFYKSNKLGYVTAAERRQFFIAFNRDLDIQTFCSASYEVAANMSSAGASLVRMAPSDL